jgi:hypothetical protein
MMIKASFNNVMAFIIIVNLRGGTLKSTIKGGDTPVNIVVKVR